MKTHRVASFLGFLLLGVPFTACDEAAPEDLESTTSESDGAPEDGTTDETTDETSTGDVAGLVGPVDDLIISPVDPQFLLPEPGYEETIAPPLSHSVKSIWGPWPKCQPKGEKTSTFLYEAPPGAVILSAYINVLSSNNGWHETQVINGGSYKFVSVQQVNQIYGEAIELAVGLGDIELKQKLEQEKAEMIQNITVFSAKGAVLKVVAHATTKGNCTTNRINGWHDLAIAPKLRYIAPPNGDMLVDQLNAKYGLGLADPTPPAPPPAPPPDPSPVCGDGVTDKCNGEQCEPGELLPYGWLCTPLCTLHCWKGNCGGVPLSDQCL
jgi:hypothetical protein